MEKTAILYKKRIGDRKEGRRLRTLEPINTVIPFLMKTRAESMNRFEDSIEISELSAYVHHLRRQGYKGINAMHVLIAAYCRVVSEFPGINRFVSGQRIFARKDIQIVMAVKKELKLNAPETMLKFYLKPDYNLFETYKEINDKIETYKTSEESDSFDGLVNILSFLPRWIFRFAVNLLYFLDYFDWIPAFLLDLSPFHCSALITSMGSLGIKPIYHHLYNFGNAPMFISFGTTRNEYENDNKGDIKHNRYLDLKFTLDDRICDGQYYASAMHALVNYIKHPQLLEEKPALIVPDIM